MVTDRDLLPSFGLCFNCDGTSPCLSGEVREKAAQVVIWSQVMAGWNRAPTRRRLHNTINSSISIHGSTSKLAQQT